MKRTGIFVAALSAIAGALGATMPEPAVREIRRSSIATSGPRIFTTIASGQSFHGATRGTRAAMKAARKRRRILAKLPK